jgi:predicted AAA+ superfamily ATPase
MFERKQVNRLAKRINEKNNPLMQVVVGPRQTGKSTMVAQALAKTDRPYIFISADDAIVPTPEWLQTEWQQARNMVNGTNKQAILAIDEIQKIPNWSTVVKSLYDADRRNNTDLKIILSGSSSLLLHKGLEDSLMGRFELVRSPHWSLTECEEAFGYDLESYLYFGGYPGAARFADNEIRWATYVRDAIIEPSISQDVLALEDIRKPALMKSLFRLGATYSGQELSFNKMLGQLQDAGNTVTLAHYLDLLEKAGMICGLQKFDAKELARKKSSPRLMVFDTALMTAVTGKSRATYESERDLRGHLVESAVGARLIARSGDEGFTVLWWREGNAEVDFVITRGADVTAIEVKSGNETRQSGMTKFLQQFPNAKRIVVGGAASGACTIEKFLRDEVPLFYA